LHNWIFREVWPEDSYFGKPGLNSDDELNILKQIFYADLGTPTGIYHISIFTSHSLTICP